MDKKVALITGASSGIGASTALALKEKGFVVYGAARREKSLEALAEKGIATAVLDLTDENSIAECVAQIAEKEGRIDVLVNNAGYGYYGAVEDVDMQEARRQIEVNLFGLARITQLVLPIMRKNSYGKIVNISSMAGRIWTPFGAWYHATKYAVEGFSAALRMEVKDFGIDVIIIEPGAIKTNWGFIAADNLEKSSAEGAYKEQAAIAAESMRKIYSGNITEPQVIAHCIAKAVTAAKPKTRYLLGYGAKAAVIVQRLFGDRLYDKAISKVYRL